MKDAYLIVYNLLQFCGWAAVLVTGRLNLLTWFQTLQLLEVVHCMVGFVKSSAFQTFMQILSRIIIVWAALVPFPETRQTIGLYMILWAWPLAETTRYIYYALNLMKLNLYVVTWLRYTLFIGLYPLGVSGELLILYQLFQLARRTGVFDYPLPNKLNVSFYGDIAIVLIVLSYVPCKYKSNRATNQCDKDNWTKRLTQSYLCNCST
jgi:very-long-chain (3R)-3-hydroxyacyl-CoA dehydratase